MSSKSGSEGLISRKTMKQSPVIPTHNMKEDQGSTEGKTFPTLHQQNPVVIPSVKD